MPVEFRSDLLGGSRSPQGLPTLSMSKLDTRLCVSLAAVLPLPRGACPANPGRGAATLLGARECWLTITARCGALAATWCIRRGIVQASSDFQGVTCMLRHAQLQKGVSSRRN